MLNRLLIATLLAAGIFFSGPAGVETAPLITLERAKTMALEQGAQMQTTRLAHSQAELSLEQLRSRFDLSPLFTPERLKDEIDQLKSLIDGRQRAINLLEESIAIWEKELNALPAGSPAAGNLLRQIDQARRDITEYNRQLGELRPPYLDMIVRYHEQKAREDQVQSQLRPAQSALASAREAMATQPELIAYGVEQTYLSLLALARQMAHQELALQNLERMRQMEQQLLKMGRSSLLRVAQAEERLSQGQESALSLLQQQENLQRTFRRQLGLPAGFSFTLAEVALAVPIGQNGTVKQEPDFTATLTYRRSLEEMERRKRDLADTPKGDRQQYRAAELSLKEAELNLQNTLASLRNNYFARSESLELAAATLRNSRLSRENSVNALANARLQHRLGLISRLALEQQEISAAEIALRLYRAHQQYHLALQAYQLSREGINPDAAAVR